MSLQRICWHTRVCVRLLRPPHNPYTIHITYLAHGLDWSALVCVHTTIQPSTMFACLSLFVTMCRKGSIGCPHACVPQTLRVPCHVPALSIASFVLLGRPPSHVIYHGLC